MLKDQVETNTVQGSQIRKLESEAVRMKRKIDHLIRECNRLEAEKRKHKTIELYLSDLLEKKKRSRNE